MHDPYLYPGTATLINKFDIQDAAKLQDLEAAFYRLKIAAPLPEGHFDYDHLQRIHQHLFGELYAWAGQERTVDIIKGHSHFARKAFIAQALNKVFDQLKHDNYLVNLDQDNFCEKLSYYFNEINAAHPFREGNGRTLRAFCDLLAEKAGYYLAWDKVAVQQYIHANIAGFNGDYAAMAAIFSTITSKLNHTQTVQQDVMHLDAEIMDTLKAYVSKRAQLSQVTRQKHEALGKNAHLVKDFSQQAMLLNAELKAIAKLLISAPGVEKLLQQSSTLPLQKQGGFSEIQDRLKKDEVSAEDLLMVLRYAKFQLTTFSQSLDREQSKSRDGQSR